MTVLLILLLPLVLVLLVLFLPIPGARNYNYAPPPADWRPDEADAVLSRRLLQPGSAAYEQYYARHPEHKEADDRSREAPGLLSPGANYYHPATFAAAQANFEVVDHLGLLVEGMEPVHGADPAASPHAGNAKDKKKNSHFIRSWLEQTGAHRVGFTELMEYHLYSRKGRGPGRGQEIKKQFPFAIALTVEMDHSMIRPAPEGSSVMESSEQYLRSGVLALKLASWIRAMGYRAQAHIDGNYEVICPLVAADAGLGIIGRMGLLMTPALGPRVRIAVVTTDMPLEPSPSRPERTTLHFCDLCKKCATNCPVGAIPAGNMEMDSGVKRWKISSEKCYHFWTTSGSDCGRCMRVCPYSHEDNHFHRFARWAIKNNLVFRHLALKLDDVFYGKKPPSRPLPGWTRTED